MIARPFLTAVVSLSVATSSMRAQVPNSQVLDSVRTSARIDSLFRKFGPQSPGCALSVIRHGEIVYSKGYGSADLEHGVLISPTTTVFHVASISKQFTALAIELLIKQGSLGLDDPVKRYVPELPAAAASVTVRHLLLHESGIRDLFDLLPMAGWRFFGDLFTEGDILDAVVRQKRLSFRPGDEHLYSNTGYVLLAVIVQRVSGLSLRDFSAAKIFAPLGMTHSVIRDNHGMLVSGRALAYAPQDTGFVLDLPQFDYAGSTSLYTTAEDMARWDRNFDTFLVGGRAAIEEMQRAGKQNSGAPIPYGFGLEINTYKGRRLITHQGGDNGYSADYLRFPDDSLSVVLLCNRADISVRQMSRSVADLFLSARYVSTTRAIEPVLPPIVGSVGQRYAGLYWSDTLQKLRRIALRNDSLQILALGRWRPLRRANDGSFVADGVDLSLHFGDERTPSRFAERLAGGASALYLRIPERVPRAKELYSFAGVYDSEELGVTWEITVHDTTLALLRRKFPSEVFRTFPSDIFIGTGVFNENYLLHFQRDTENCPVGFRVTTESSRSIEFWRRPTPRNASRLGQKRFAACANRR